MNAKNPASYRDRESGSLLPQIGAYLSFLREQGYKRSTTYYDELLLMALDRWLGRRGTNWRGLDECVATTFLRYHMRTRRTNRAAKWATLRRFLTLLRRRGELPEKPPPKRSRIEELLDDFGQYLTADLGFVATTVAGYRRAVRTFLVECFGDGAIDLRSIDAPRVIDFARHQAQRHVPITTQGTLCGLRSFLRFLWGRQILPSDLSSSVPRIAIWSLAGLPKHLPAGAVDKVIACSSDVGAIGSRNHAILLVFARLGLRACEVADLKLDDLDWDRGLIRVRSRKGGRWATMPLPADVGRAVAAYLVRGRPKCGSRHLFIRSGAPMTGMTRMGMANVARAAMIRAGITGVRRGPHTFRHTLATDLLRHGATLHDVGEVLRHRDASTTAIYAKVDLSTLQSLAVAWPGGAS